jgi:hypothetical protein
LRLWSFGNSRDSRPAPVSTQPPIQRVLGALSLGIKRPGVKLTTHVQLLPRSRKCGSIHPLPHKPSWRSAQLVKHRDNCTLFTFMGFWARTYATVKKECLMEVDGFFLEADLELARPPRKQNPTGQSRQAVGGCCPMNGAEQRLAQEWGQTNKLK